MIRLLLLGAAVLGGLIGAVYGWISYDESFPDGPA